MRKIKHAKTHKRLFNTKRNQNHQNHTKNSKNSLKI